MYKGLIRKPDQAILPISSKRMIILYCLNLMNRLKKSLFPIKSIEQANNKNKKNDVVNKDNTTPTNDIIIPHSLFSNKYDELALSSEYTLSSNAELMKRKSFTY